MKLKNVRFHAEIENYLCKKIKQEKGMCIKLTSSSLRALPDRICMLPGGVIAFIKVKAGNRKLNVANKAAMAMFRRLGFTTVCIKSFRGVDALIKMLKQEF